MNSLSRIIQGIALFAACLIVLASCEQDVYDKGDSEYSYMRADFVEAYVGTDKQVNYVVTDDGDRLELMMPFTASWIQTADTIYRAVLYHNRKDNKAEALTLARISTLSVRQNAMPIGTIKTDPVGLESVWMSANKKYLNMALILKSGALEADGKPHSVGLVLKEVTTNADSTKTCQLHLAHNQADVPEYYSQRVYLSVALQGLDTDSLSLTVKTYDGLVTRRFCLKPKQSECF